MYNVYNNAGELIESYETLRAAKAAADERTEQARNSCSALVITYGIARSIWSHMKRNRRANAPHSTTERAM